MAKRVQIPSFASPSSRKKSIFIVPLYEQTFDYEVLLLGSYPFFRKCKSFFLLQVLIFDFSADKKSLSRLFRDRDVLV